MKLGGDKGHGVFKLTIQLVNVATPNSRACAGVFRVGSLRFEVLEPPRTTAKAPYTPLEAGSFTTWPRALVEC